MASFLKGVFFLIIIVGIVIYFISNPPTLFKGTPLEKIFSSSSQSTTSKSASSAPQKTSVPQTEVSNQIPSSQIPPGYTIAQLSPYFKKVRISSAYASNYSGYPTQFDLYSSFSNGEKIDITGWDIATNHGSLRIPQAVNDYDFSNLSPQQDIVLSSNSHVYFYSNKSPINVNFRLNKCIGYLENNYVFNPALPRNCPTINRSQVSYLAGYCQNYIFSLGSCAVPSIAKYNSFPGNEEGNACRQFLGNISANNCYRDHRNDSDFLSSEWRVWFNWTGINNILDSAHDRVRLFDENGLLVDQYIY